MRRLLCAALLAVPLLCCSSAWSRDHGPGGGNSSGTAPRTAPTAPSMPANPVPYEAVLVNNEGAVAVRDGKSAVPGQSLTLFQYGDAVLHWVVPPTGGGIRSATQILECFLPGEPLSYKVHVIGQLPREEICPLLAEEERLQRLKPVSGVNLSFDKWGNFYRTGRAWYHILFTQPMDMAGIPGALKGEVESYSAALQDTWQATSTGVLVHFQDGYRIVYAPGEVVQLTGGVSFTVKPFMTTADIKAFGEIEPTRPEPDRAKPSDMPPEDAVSAEDIAQIKKSMSSIGSEVDRIIQTEKAMRVAKPAAKLADGIIALLILAAATVLTAVILLLRKLFKARRRAADKPP